MSVRRLTVVMDVDTGRATASLGRAGSAVKQFGLDTRRASDHINSMGRSFNSLGDGMQRPMNSLREYVLTLGNLRFALIAVNALAVGWVWSLMKQAGELERLTVLMAGFSKATTEAGRTEEATQNLRKLMNMARETGFEVKALADAFVKFQSAGLDPQVHSLNGLTQAVAKFGGTSDIMHRASIAIQQMAGKGKISMEELRQQLGEAVPSAMQIMANSLGVTMEKLGDEIKKGNVKAKPALELMLRDMEIKFAGAGKKLANTFFGQLAQVKTNMMDLAGSFSGMGREGGLFEGAKNALKELNDLMRSGEGKQAMMDLGNAIASIAGTLAGALKFVIEWRNEIGYLALTLGKLWLIAKGAEVIGWMARMGMTAADAFRNMGNAAVQSQGLLGDWTRSSDAMVSSIERQRVASEGWVQRTKDRVAVAQSSVAATQREIAALTEMNRTYAQNITMLQAQQRQERSNLQTAQTLHAANLATGRSGAQSAIMVKNAQDQLNNTTRSLISQRRLLTQTTAQLTAAENGLRVAETSVTAAVTRLTAAERANAVSKGFLATAARAATGSISLLIMAINGESAALARSTIQERISTMAKGAYTSAARMAGMAASFMGRMCSLALGPIGMIGMAAYTAAQYFGFFANKANDAAAAARNLAGSMASLNDVKAITARMEEIDDATGKNGVWAAFKSRFKEKGLVGAFAPTTPGKVREEQSFLQLERFGLEQDLKKHQGNAYANAGREEIETWRQQRQNWVETFTTRKEFVDKMEALDARIMKGGKDAAAATRERNALTNSVARGQLNITQAQFNRTNTALRAAERQYGANSNQARRLRAQVVELRNDLNSLRQVGEAGALQLEAFTAGGEGGKGKGKGRGIDTIANSVGNLTGEIAGLEAKLRGDVSTNLVQFEANLKAGGFAGKTDKEIALERRKAMLKDEIADRKRQGADDNAYESMLASLTGRLAELNDELIGGEGNLAKFNAQKDAGKFEGLTPEQIDRLRETAAALDNAEFDKRIKELDKDLTKATAETEAMWGSFNSGAMTAAKRLAGLRAGFEDKLIGLDPDRLEQAKQKIEQIVSKLNEAEAAKFMQGLNDDAGAARRSLMPEREARIAEFEQERAERKTQLDSFLMDEQIHFDRKQEMQRAYNMWVFNERKRLDRQNEHAVVGMMRQWANLGQNIEQALSGAMSKFVDGLAEGKLSFRDFAKDLLKQLLKIIIQAMIAYAILSAIGQAPAGGFGGFMKSQIASGFGVPTGGGISESGATEAGTNHHGGYVGDGMGMTKMVSSAMFKAASKYHTGGGIDKLGPKEVPLIGLEGERVLTEEQQRQLGRDMAEGGAGKAPPVTINFINNSSEPLSAEQSEPQFDGKEMVIGIVVESLSKQGRLRDAVNAIGRDGH